MKQKIRVLLFGLTIFLLSAGVYARDLRELDSTIVTAQKIEEDVQSVPISMTVLDEFDIQDKRIESAKDIAKYTPNLLLFNMNSSGVLMPTIRGLNTDYGSFSTSMAMFIDGVPIIGTSGLDATIADVERIEVLKGPQGTLYGKGTEAGVINIITKKPDNEIRGRVSLDFGNDNKRQYTFNVSGPIVKDKFYIGLAAKHYEKDGFVYNANLKRNADDIENDYGKIYLRFNPVSNFDISLISSKLKNDNTGAPTAKRDQEDREKYTNEEYTKTETELHALKAEYSFGSYKIESITSKKLVEDNWLMDYDQTPEATSHAQNFSDKENFSQELKLSSSTDVFSWLIGFNYSKDELELKTKTLFGDGFSTLDTRTYGLFTHLDYRLSDQFSLVGGLRYDKTESDFKEPSRDLGLNISFKEISPKIGMEYKVTDSNMLYTAISKGYRPAGFYTWARPGYPKEYDQETLWSYEIGSKNSFLDDRLILNAALYYMKIDDMQVHVFIDNSYSAYKANAAKATSQGFEFDMNYKATKSVKFFASVGYNDMKFDDYKDAKGDYSGNYNPYAPKYNYNFGAQYRGDKGYYARVDVNGYGKMYLDTANQYSRGAYDLVDAKVGYERESYDIYLYADNLFDKRYDTIGTFGGGGRTFSPPREVGVQLTYRF